METQAADAVQDGDHPRRLGAVASTTGAEDPRPTLGMFEVGIKYRGGVTHPTAPSRCTAGTAAEPRLSALVASSSHAHSASNATALRPGIPNPGDQHRWRA